MNGAAPLLSVVIPTLGRPTLDDQFDALARCHWDHPWEVLAADNGSDGAVGRACDRWSSRLPGLRVVDASDRAGRSHAVNCGARAARGRWLLLVDDDDLVDPSIIEAVGSAFESGARVVVFNLNIREVNDDAVWSSSSNAMATEAGRPMFRSLPAVWGCAGIERDLFLALGGFDEALPYAEDLDFTVRLHEADGPEPVWLPRQLIHYRLRGEPRARFRQRVEVAKAIQTISLRHPAVAQPLGGNRWYLLAREAAAVAPGLRHAAGRAGRLALADRCGDVWGRFRARAMAS